MISKNSMMAETTTPTICVALEYFPAAR